MNTSNTSNVVASLDQNKAATSSAGAGSSSGGTATGKERVTSADSASPGGGAAEPGGSFRGPGAVKSDKMDDVHHHMKIRHFEELMRIFQEEQDRITRGFSMEKFCEVFDRVFQGALSNEQLTILFMKIDANSDGTVTWDEFSGYMMTGTINVEAKLTVLEEKSVPFATLPEISHPHREMIKHVEFIPKERKYVSVSRDGMVCVWGANMRLLRQIDTKEYTPNMTWVSDAVCLHDQGKLVTVNDDRKVYVFDLFSVKPRLLAVFGPMDNAPLCISYHPKYEENKDLLLWGDDGGFVNVLFLSKRFFMDHVSEDKPCFLDPAILTKADMQAKYNLRFYRRKVHNEWVLKVMFYTELNGVVSCAGDNSKALAISDIERRTVRYLRLQRGIKCFDYCRRPSFIVTGGRDKVIRVWNPYVLTKAAASLTGHTATVLKIVMNNDAGHIISMSDDKVIKVWSARTLHCLQTIYDRENHRPENAITAINYDAINRLVLIGHGHVEAYFPQKYAKIAIARSHDAGVVSLLYNENFHQVVSGCTDSSVRVWNLVNGERTFEFEEVHGQSEITAMSFDKTGRRLLTGSRNGVVRMWNFNNGQMLQQMYTTMRSEITQIIYIETISNKYIICVGWDRRISFFEDDPGNFNSTPQREFQTSASETSFGVGHEDDVLCVDFLEPHLLVTGGLDGKICVWNADTGHCRATLNEPMLHLRNHMERAVEKMRFLRPPQREDFDLKAPEVNYPLVTVSADGYVRFWDLQAGRMLLEVLCQLGGAEGLTSLVITPDTRQIIVGDTDGIVRVLDVSKFQLVDNKRDYKNACEIINLWKAHDSPISSVEYVHQHRLVLTCSKDRTIRVWTEEGKHIGIFGQDKWWDLEDSLTFAPWPMDVAHLQNLKQSLPSKAALQARRIALKTMVINKMKVGALGITPEVVDLAELELTEMFPGQEISIEQIKERSIMKAVANKWKTFAMRRVTAKRAQKRSDVDLHASISGKNYFVYQDNKPRQNHASKTLQIRAESAFHSLAWHAVGELQMHPKLVERLAAAAAAKNKGTTVTFYQQSLMDLDD